MGIRDLYDDRFNPFTASELPKAISNEVQAVPSFSPFQIQLNEIPQQAGGVTISGYTEVTTTPTSGQFRVDYTYKTGLVEFHSSAAGAVIQASYNGLGTPLLAEFVSALQTRHPLKSYQADVWRFEEFSEHFTYDQSDGFGSFYPFATSMVRRDQWIISSSVIGPVILPEIHSCRLPVIDVSDKKNNFIIGSFKYLNAGTAPAFRCESRFRVNLSSWTGDSQFRFAVGVGSVANPTPINSAVFVAGAFWVMGSTYGSLAFELNGTTLFTVIPTNITSFQDYVIDYTPGLLTLSIGNSVVASSATWISSGAVTSLILGTRLTSTSAATFYLDIDMITATVISTSPLP